MTIDLTDNQFRVLTRALFISTVITGEVAELDSEIDLDEKEYAELLDYVVARADDFKSGDDIEIDPKKKKNVVSHKLEEECGEILESFEEIVFWDDLIHRLASRDMHNKFGHDALEAMSVEELIDKESPLIDKYAEEFEKNGIEHLTVK
ncbi:MAG: hypothetical protein A2Y33_01810 [Spirochaetes bacterium GWF1_51_8]|nr:MAG: hypothetical protein A2Y33_01810 [Spirochaetes bacterium GWF1_51_8]